MRCSSVLCLQFYFFLFYLLLRAADLVGQLSGLVWAHYKIVNDCVID